MDTLLIKKKIFEVVEKKGERTFKVQFKNKVYFARYFPNNDSEFDDFIYIGKRISALGVEVPKFRFIDRKNGYIVMDYIEGESVMETLIKQDLTEKYYEKIFLYAWYTKTSKMALSFKPEHFIFKDDKLYYVAFVFYNYDEKHDFTNNTSLRLWFYTRDFINYIEEKGFKGDKNRIKSEYDLNKQIVLTACKYSK